jgi:hypothetical protein
MTATWDSSADSLSASAEPGAAGEVDLMLVERALRAYVQCVAAGLGLGAAATYCEMAEQPSAYIALDDRVPGWPDQDAALVWDLDHGWAVSVEIRAGDDLLIVAYPGAPLVPPPRAVIAFAAATLANPPATPGTPTPARRCSVDQVAEQLLAYLPSSQ